MKKWIWIILCILVVSCKNSVQNEPEIQTAYEKNIILPFKKMTEVYPRPSLNEDIISKEQIQLIAIMMGDWEWEYEFLKEVSKKGDYEAMVKLADLYFYGGRFPSVDAKRGLYWLDKGAKLGSSLGQCQLGYLYSNGRYMKKDNKKAFDLYNSSFKKGNLVAGSNLAVMHFYGYGTQKNPGKAFELLFDLANKGETSAMCKLAFIYENGIGTKKDKKKSDYWNEKFLSLVRISSE